MGNAKKAKLLVSVMFVIGVAKVYVKLLFKFMD